MRGMVLGVERLEGSVKWFLGAVDTREIFRDIFGKILNDLG